MRTRVIREAMLEAHQIAEEFPDEVWYICNDDFFSIVKDTYFINDDGTRKVKPFISLYNTRDKRYMNHVVNYVDGVITIDSNVNEDYFDQEYGELVIEKTRNVGVSGGFGGRGHIDAMLLHAQNMSRTLHMPDFDKNMSAIVKLHDDLEDEVGITHESIEKLLKKLPPMIITEKHNTHWDKYTDWREYETRFPYEDDFIIPKRFDMATGKMVEDIIHKPLSEAKRIQLRKKRKKRRR